MGRFDPWHSRFNAEINMSYRPLDSDQAVNDWLKHYGYDDVKTMQSSFGLVDDGFVGPKTLEVMEQPRCGVSDFRAAADCRWHKTDLTYWNGRGGFSLFHKEMRKTRSRTLSRDIIDQGFARWAEVTNFKFTRVGGRFDRNSTDLWVGGGNGRRHGFDGPGRTLAWAHMPCGTGFKFLQSRFDMAESFTNDTSKAKVDPWIYAYTVWLHELGHLLGLDHSRNPNDIMAPHYNPELRDLQPGDIARIRRLYGLST